VSKPSINGSRSAPAFYGATVFTLPGLGWKLVETPQGLAFEFLDGSHDWPSPRERQVIDAFRRYVEATVAPEGK